MKITNQIRNTKGFSLVELMVVVAIIGILAAIAVPNVTKYMMKARQSEAKTNLAAIYSAEKALFVEYNGYSTRFSAIGYAPEGQLRYRTGFGLDQTTLASLGPAYTAIAQAPFTAQGYCTANPASCTCLPAECAGALAIPNTSTVSLVGALPTFTATARANLRKSAALANDEWTINEVKTITQTLDGVN